MKETEDQCCCFVCKGIIGPRDEHVCTVLIQRNVISSERQIESPLFMRNVISSERQIESPLFMWAHDACVVKIIPNEECAFWVACWQEGRLSSTTPSVDASWPALPQYDFLCRSCKKLFSKNLTPPEYKLAVINCPFCGTDDVEQGRWIAFHSVPDTKSA